MKRRAVLVVLASGLGAARRARAQTQAAIPRVAVLSFGVADAPLSRDGQAAFEAGLRQLGWTPGTTVAVEYRWADNDSDRLAQHIAELLRATPDVIVARTGVVQRALVRATRTIPIVLSGAVDPVSEGFVQSVARPGGNVTGLSLQIAALLPKRIELLKEAVPQGLPRFRSRSRAGSSSSST